MEGRRLKVWLGHADEGAPAPLPTLGQVLYTHPNPDGSRKMCGNCVLWMQDMRQCHIFDSDVLVVPDMICGYHVFGQSRGGVVDLSRENIEPVEPELAGLEQVPGGVSCDTCTFYGPRGQAQGACRAVVSCDHAGPALVASMGCCTRWTSKGG